MGEARRKSEKGLTKSSKNIQKNSSQRIFSFLPITEVQEKLFIQITIKGAWIGIGFLVCLWIVVRFIGPAFGWWIPADVR